MIPATIILVDSGDNQWLLGVADDGALTATPTTGQTPSTLILSDVGYQYLWTVGVTTLGQLTTTQGGPASLSDPTHIILEAPDSDFFFMSIQAGGALQTTPPATQAANCGVNIVLLDTNGNQWLMGVTSSGELTTQLTLGQQVSSPMLADVSYQYSWTIGVTTLGQLTTTPSYPALLSQNTTLLISSPGNVYYYVSVQVSGALQTRYINIPTLPPIVLGELYNYDLLAMYPPADQPGGIGTPVTDPVQTVDEINGRFRPGCGHSIQSYDCTQASINCVPMKIIRCPLCGYVQRLMTIADFYNNTTNPILQA